MKKSRLFKKRAVDWAGPIDKTLHRQDQQMVKSVWNGIANKLHQLKQNLKVKGQPLGAFLSQHPISELFTSNDPEVKRTGYQLRSLINEFVTSEFETSVLNRFKEEAGSNVTQWLDKTGKQASGQACPECGGLTEDSYNGKALRCDKCRQQESRQEYLERNPPPEESNSIEIHFDALREALNYIDTAGSFGHEAQSKGNIALDAIESYIAELKGGKQAAKEPATGLRMQPDYGEAGSYTTEANEENSKEAAGGYHKQHTDMKWPQARVGDIAYYEGGKGTIQGLRLKEHKLRIKPLNGGEEFVSHMDKINKIEPKQGSKPASTQFKFKTKFLQK